MLQGEQIMTKYINILEFIGILQFNQTHHIFEINVAKEIKKIVARNFNKTLICLFYCIFKLLTPAADP